MAAKRNPNGEGTIYRRKDGRYEGAGYVLMPDGTQKRRRVYGKTWEEARKKLTEMLAKSDQGIPAADTVESLASYLTYWLDHVVRHKVRASTVYSYSKCVNAYIVPGSARRSSRGCQPKTCGSSSTGRGRRASAAFKARTRRVRRPSVVAAL